MKLLKPLTSVLLACAVVGGGAAWAQQPKPTLKIKPGVVSQIPPGGGGMTLLNGGVIKGDIAVPSSFSASGYGKAESLASFTCSNLVITANSKEMKPKPPGATGFYIPQPVWTKSTKATGTWSAGKCSYSLSVPADKEFNLVGGSSGSFNCSSVELGVTNTPASQSVPKGENKTDDVTVPKVTCNVIG